MFCCITVIDRLDVFRFHRVWQKSQRKKDGMTNRTGNACRLGKFAILCVCILWYYIPSSSVSRASVAHLATDPVLTLKSALRIRSPNSISRVNVYLIGFCAEHLVARSRSNTYCFFVFYPICFVSFILNSMKPRKFFVFTIFNNLPCVPQKNWTMTICGTYLNESNTYYQLYLQLLPATVGTDNGHSILFHSQWYCKSFY